MSKELRMSSVSAEQSTIPRLWQVIHMLQFAADTNAETVREQQREMHKLRAALELVLADDRQDGFLSAQTSQAIQKALGNV